MSSPQLQLNAEAEMQLGLALITQGQQLIAQGTQHINNAKLAAVANKAGQSSGYNANATQIPRNQSFVNNNQRTFGVSNFNDTHISRSLKNMSPDSRWQADIECCHDLAKFAIKYLATGAPLRETAKMQFVRKVGDNQVQPYTRAQVCGEESFNPESPLNSTRVCENMIESHEEWQKAYPECHALIQSMDKADLQALAMALKKSETLLIGQQMFVTMMDPAKLTRIPFPRDYLKAMASEQ